MKPLYTMESQNRWVVDSYETYVLGIISNVIEYEQFGYKCIDQLNSVYSSSYAHVIWGYKMLINKQS